MIFKHIWILKINNFSYITFLTTEDLPYHCLLLWLKVIGRKFWIRATSDIEKVHFTFFYFTKIKTVFEWRSKLRFAVLSVLLYVIVILNDQKNNFNILWYSICFIILKIEVFSSQPTNFTFYYCTKIISLTWIYSYVSKLWLLMPRRSIKNSFLQNKVLSEVF